MRSGGAGGLLLPAALLVGVAASRLVGLHLDPPPYADVAFLCDEGWWAHNARNRALFGQFVLDEHNPPLFTAPFHTLALLGVYELFGVGLVSTRLLSGLSGVALCALVLFGLRAAGHGRAGLVAATVLAFDPFLWAHQRLGLVEPFQLLLVTAAGLAALGALRRPWLGVPAGAAAAAALLSKPTGAVGGAVAGLLLAHAAVAPRLRGGPPDGSGRRGAAGLAAMAAGSAAVLVPAAVAALPHLDAVVGEWVSHGILAARPGADLADRLLLFGVSPSPGPTTFFDRSGPLVLAAGLVLALRLLCGAAGRAAPAGPAAARRAADPGTRDLWRLAGLWLAVALAFVALQGYQPDRRFLMLGPPLALMLGLAWEEGIRVPAGRRIEALRRPRGLAAGAVLGAAALLVAREPALALADALTGWIPLGTEPGLSLRSLHALTWMAAPGAGLLALALLPPTRSRRALRASPALLLLPVLALGGVRIGSGFLHQGATLAEAARGVEEEIAALPPERRVVVGNAADSFALGSDAFTFVIRHWPPFGMAMNLDGLARYRPALVVTAEVDGNMVGDREVFDLAPLPVLRRIPVLPDERGRPRGEVVVYRAPQARGSAAPGEAPGAGAGPEAAGRDR